MMDTDIPYHPSRGTEADERNAVEIKNHHRMVLIAFSW
jgi:hypothetical protein